MSTAEPLTVAHVKFSIVFRNRASLMPLSFVFGRSSTRKAAKLAVYEATMIIAKPAQTMPRTRALKLRGVPSPMPLLRRTPHANQMAELRLRASSSVLSLVECLKRPNGENLNRGGSWLMCSVSVTIRNTTKMKYISKGWFVQQKDVFLATDTKANRKKHVLNNHAKTEATRCCDSLAVKTAKPLNKQHIKSCMTLHQTETSWK